MGEEEEEVPIGLVGCDRFIKRNTTPLTLLKSTKLFSKFASFTKDEMSAALLRSSEKKKEKNSIRVIKNFNQQIEGGHVFIER